jgi:hypothetical protein
MQTLGRMPMQSSVRRDLCQEELTAYLCTRSFLSFYLRKEMMYHPPSLFSLIDSPGPERLWSNIHLGDVVAYLWLSVALLDFCKGTRLANVDRADKVEVMGHDRQDIRWPNKVGGNKRRWRWLRVQYNEMEDMCHRGLRGRMTNINAPSPGLLLDDQVPNPWARFWALSEIRGSEFQSARNKGCQLPEI